MMPSPLPRLQPRRTRGAAESATSPASHVATPPPPPPPEPEPYTASAEGGSTSESTQALPSVGGGGGGAGGGGVSKKALLRQNFSNQRAWLACSKPMNT